MVENQIFTMVFINKRLINICMRMLFQGAFKFAFPRRQRSPPPDFIIATPGKGLNFNMEGDDDDLESSLARAFLTVDLLQER